jgi:RNA recognition motif-containing protein
MKIHVTNLNRKTTAQHLFQLFRSFGRVNSVRIFMDALTGHSLGTGYIEMDPEAGSKAIKDLNNRIFMNSFMEVNEAPPSDNPRLAW